jgi:hypothetical protein
VEAYTKADAEAALADALDREDWDAVNAACADLDRLDPPARPTILGAALWYAEQGLPVFPLQLGGKQPLKGSRGLHDATTDLAVVREMFAVPRNLAIATGHRVDVIDFDGKDAHRAWSKRFQADDELPPGAVSFDPARPPTGDAAWTPAGVARLGTVSTPRDGGLHVYVPATGRGNRANLGGLVGVDYRGLGGYVVVPPSSTPDGHYVWLKPLDLAGAADE